MFSPCLVSLHSGQKVTIFSINAVYIWILCIHLTEIMEGETMMGERTKKRYDRLARFYDFLEAPLEKLRFASWRTRLRDRIRGPLALEVGVGTGKNFPFYPSNVEMTAIDFSPRMLLKAHRIKILFDLPRL